MTDDSPAARLPQVEVCADRLDVAVAAEAAGADRIELNQALELDGLTPSLGLVREVVEAVTIPVIAMARPRAGHFRYSASEWRVLCRDVELLLSQGVAGFAFGCLDGEGRIDLERVHEIRQLTQGRELVFHRAFDEGGEPQRLEQLVDAGVDRVMTSGGEGTAIAGAAAIAGWVRAARGRIGILPASGIDETNVGQLLAATGCVEVHGTFGTRAEASLGALVDRIEGVRRAVQPPRSPSF